MSNQETLQQLLARRLRELGRSRGRDEPLSLLEAYEAADVPGKVSYELVRRVQKEGHHRVGARAVRTLATMLDVPAKVIEEAAGLRPSLEPFTLPPRADRLEVGERRVVLAVIDAILNASQIERADLGGVVTVDAETVPPPGSGTPRRGRSSPRQGPA